MKRFLIFWTAIFLISVFDNETTAQSGGIFEIKQSVIASGGSSNSAGGNFTLDGTIGQTNAGGSLQNSPFSIYSGFLTPSLLAPTAATVSIGGRVLLTKGQGVRNVSLTLTNSRGETRNAATGSFGYYRFTEVTVGETYVLELRSKRFVFANPVRIISVTDELTNIDFVTEE
jgi:hypothetical protein